MIDQKRIARVLDRLEDLERLLGDPDTLANPKRLKEVVREHAALKRLEADVKKYTSAVQQLADDQALIDDPSTDADLREMAQEEIPSLKETIAAATRPTFLCSHHPASGLGIPMSIYKNRIVPGYLHGHTHQWTTGYLRGDFDETARMLREVGIPTLGFEWDVGWGLMRTTAKGATLLCNARDFYYPLPVPKAKRPAEWDMHVRDWAGRTIGFSFEV